LRPPLSVHVARIQERLQQGQAHNLRTLVLLGLSKLGIEIEDEYLKNPHSVVGHVNTCLALRPDGCEYIPRLVINYYFVKGRFWGYWLCFKKRITHAANQF